MAAKKITKKDVIASMLDVEGVKKDAELKEFLQAELARLNKASNSEKAKEKRRLDDSLKENILKGIPAGSKYRVVDLINAIPALTGFTPQKITPLCKQLVSEGKLLTVCEKRANYYYIEG